jgi:hypothetical protein
MRGYNGGERYEDRRGQVMVENRAESETNFGGLLTWRTDTGIVALITERVMVGGCRQR